MKTEFLKELGLAQEAIAKIMAENGKDVEAEKAKTTAKIGELATANQSIADLQAAVKKFDGVDVEKLRSDLTALQSKYDQDIAQVKLDAAIDLALIAAKAHDSKAVKPFLNMDAIKVNGDTVIGLEEQLKGLRESKAFLFASAETQPAASKTKTGMSHQGGGEGSPNKNEEINSAFRAAFGKEG